MVGMSAPVEPHVSERIPAYALDSLNAAETRQVIEHLARCADCRAELNAYLQVADALGLAAPLAAPPPSLKRHVLARLPGAAPAAPLRPAPRPAPRPTNRPRLSLPLAFAGLLLVVLGLSNLALWQRLRGLAQPAADFRVVSLLGGENAPGASGLLVMDPEGDQGTLVVNGLPALDPTRQYQLWLIRDGQRASGGVFSVSASGYGWLGLTAATPLYQVDGYGVTIEPAGGSPGPTGARVLSGKP